VKLRYEAFSPADDSEQDPREQIAQGELELPDDAGLSAVHGALENAVERVAAVDAGSQVRVIARRDDEDEPSIWYVWDHG